MENNNENLENITVNDRDTFTTFLRLFRNDLEVNSVEWENSNLKDFLEAMERYTQDIQGYYENTEQKNEDANQASWKRFADILMGARIYE